MTKRIDGSNGCDLGVFSAAVAYDKWVGRYMISAICNDVLKPRILLAVSTVDSVTDYWTLYAVTADNSATSWDCANGFRAFPDYSQARRAARQSASPGRKAAGVLRARGRRAGVASQPSLPGAVGHQPSTVTPGRAPHALFPVPPPPWSERIYTYTVPVSVGFLLGYPLGSLGAATTGRGAARRLARRFAARDSLNPRLPPPPRRAGQQPHPAAQAVLRPRVHRPRHLPRRPRSGAV